jgi:hypothetical protein
MLREIPSLEVTLSETAYKAGRDHHVVAQVPFLELDHFLSRSLDGRDSVENRPQFPGGTIR